MSKKKCPSGNCNCLAPYESNAPCNDHANFTCFRLNRFKDITGIKPYREFPMHQSRLYQDFAKTGKLDEECPPERKHHQKTKKPQHDNGAAHAIGNIPTLDMDQYIQM